MRLANLDGRATIVTDTGIVDLASASGGALPSDPDQAIAALRQVKSWYASHDPSLDTSRTIASLMSDLSQLGAPVPTPRQIFAIGLNYADHGAETGRSIPDEPLVFTKFGSAITGPGSSIPLPTSTCDWEVELVVIIGVGGRNIATADALEHVAGFCIGQDISERRSQMRGTRPQFSLAKSHAGFAPTGPWLTTLDELDDPNDLAIEAAVDDELVQASRTKELVFDVAALVAHLSTICELFAGDLIFTGTPAGVGHSRSPARYLVPGSTLSSTIEGLGEMRNPCIAAPPAEAHTTR
ncbi:fumarylacetoacetate hydrolase family protein [Nocardia sp. NPDC055002]